jgi:hypothetical protein
MWYVSRTKWAVFGHLVPNIGKTEEKLSQKIS